MSDDDALHVIREAERIVRAAGWDLQEQVVLERLAGTRLTRDGVLVIIAQRHRTQGRNRQDALARLIDLVREAAVAPRLRRATRPSKASRERRVEAKKHRSSLKRLRRGKPSFD